MDKLKLSVPRQLDADNPLVDRNPRAVARRVADLPLLNLGASVKKLMADLSALNTQPLPDSERLALLDIYRPAVNALVLSYESHALRRVPMTAGERRQLKLDVARLSAVLADGYKIIIRNLHRLNVDPAQDATLLAAIYRAVAALSLSLLHCLRIYTRPLDNLFLELHQLYCYADATDVGDCPVQGETDNLPTTVAGVYKQIMLLVCADPARLTDAEVLRLFELLGDYSGHCECQPGQCDNPPPGVFVIDVHDDVPPGSCARLGGSGMPEESYVLDARPLSGAVASKLQQIDSSGQQAAADEERRLMQVLLSRIGDTQTRQAERQVAQGSYLVAAGIPAIHHFLTDKSQFARAAADAGSSIEVHESGEAEVDATLETWSVVNQSEAGFMLRRKRKLGVDLHVGEVMGLFPEPGAGNPEPDLTVIRWMRHNSEGFLEVGVERIPGAPAPVKCHPLWESRTPLAATAALFIASNAARQQPAALMTPKRFYGRGRPIRLDVGDKSLTVEAGHLQMDTACFDRFGFLAKQ